MAQALGHVYGKDAAMFLNVKQYKHLIKWAKMLEKRPAIKRALKINAPWESGGLHERHKKTIMHF